MLTQTLLFPMLEMGKLRLRDFNAPISQLGFVPRSVCLQSARAHTASHCLSLKLLYSKLILLEISSSLPHHGLTCLMKLSIANVTCTQVDDLGTFFITALSSVRVMPSGAVCSPRPSGFFLLFSSFCSQSYYPAF